MTATVWIDGRIVGPDEPTVAALDHGITVGAGVFETLKVYGGVPFAVRRHLERMAASAAGIGLDLPASDVLQRAITEVLAASPLRDARLRLTVTGGLGPLGSERATGKPTVLAAVAELPEQGPVTSVVTVPWPRNERGALAGLKTTSYAENVVALARAKEAGASEAIFGNTVGNLCEGTGTNVFLVVDGRLVTPPLSSGCLAGVTRGLVLQLCDVEERDVPMSALVQADEAFLTSTTREVQAIAAVDGHALPAGPGPMTRAAMEAFSNLVATDLDP
jgi:branched-chain amino acid aminotransferase